MVLFSYRWHVFGPCRYTTKKEVVKNNQSTYIFPEIPVSTAKAQHNQLDKFVSLTRLGKTSPFLLRLNAQVLLLLISLPPLATNSLLELFHTIATLTSRRMLICDQIFHNAHALYRHLAITPPSLRISALLNQSKFCSLSSFLTTSPITNWLARLIWSRSFHQQAFADSALKIWFPPGLALEQLQSLYKFGLFVNSLSPAHDGETFYE